MLQKKGVQEYVFEEIKRIGEIEFDFMDKSSPVNYCVNLAGKMQLFSEPENVADLIRSMYVVE